MEKMFHFTSDLIEPCLKASDKADAVKQLIRPLIEKQWVSESYGSAVLEREKEYPTGLVTPGAVIAMPHAFNPSVKGTHVVIGVLEQSIPFYNMENIDEEVSVEIIFLLAINGAKEQLEMLKVLMNVFKSKELLEKMKSGISKEEICEELNEFLRRKV